MSIKDSSTLCRLAYFDKLYLIWYWLCFVFFSFKSHFIYSKSH